jgi:hypothetical protein
MTKIPKMKYPWASIDFTQAEGKYSLTVAVSENFNIEVGLDDSDLDYLESEIKSMREHQKHLRAVRKRVPNKDIASANP